MHSTEKLIPTAIKYNVFTKTKFCFIHKNQYWIIFISFLSHFNKHFLSLTTHFNANSYVDICIFPLGKLKEWCIMGFFTDIYNNKNNNRCQYKIKCVRRKIQQFTPSNLVKHWWIHQNYLTIIPKVQNTSYYVYG
jgi:hypothetical protein